MNDTLKTANVRQVKTFGQVCYEEFCKQQAVPFTEWEGLPVLAMHHWDAAATAAIKHMQKITEEQLVLQEQAAKTALAGDTAELDAGNAGAVCQSPCGGPSGGSPGDPAKKQAGSSVGLVATAEPEKIATTLGQVAYEAYASKLGWKSGVTGAPLPSWADDKVLPAIKDGWEESGQAVALVVLHGLTVTRVDGPEAEALLKKQQAGVVSNQDARSGAGFAVTGSAG